MKCFKLKFNKKNVMTNKQSCSKKLIAIEDKDE